MAPKTPVSSNVVSVLTFSLVSRQNSRLSPSPSPPSYGFIDTKGGNRRRSRGGGGGVAASAAVASAVDTEGQQDSWLQLSKLYAALGERDALVGVAARASRLEGTRYART